MLSQKADQSTFSNTILERERTQKGVKGLFSNEDGVMLTTVERRKVKERKSRT